MATRTALHEVIERLPDDALEAAERALSGVAESTVSLRASLEHAEIDDEPLTDDDLAAIDRGWRLSKKDAASLMMSSTRDWLPPVEQFVDLGT